MFCLNTDCFLILLLKVMVAVCSCVLAFKVCGCFVSVLQTGLTNRTNSIGLQQTVTQQQQLPKDSSDLLNFKKVESEWLEFNASVHQESNKDSHYVFHEKEYLVLQNALRCLG